MGRSSPYVGHLITGYSLPFDEKALVAVRTNRWSNPSDVPHLKKHSTPDMEDSWLDVIDRTALEFDFDCSCLEDLDEQLLLSPLSSFVDVCWSQAVYDHRTRTGTRAQATTSTPGRPVHHRDPYDSDESCSSDESLTTPVLEKKDLASADDFVGVNDIYSALRRQIVYIDQLLVKDQDNQSFINFDPPLSVSKPQELVNYFPVRPTPPPATRTKMSLRLRAMLPGRPRLKTL